MDKRFLAIVGVIVVLFVGIVLVSNKKNNTKTSGNANQATNHVIGATNAKVTLIEYGDYECPVCEGYFPVVQQVQQKYNDTVKVQFRNLPLSQIHPNAIAGARAAEAADMQGKYWAMHDQLYGAVNWNQWSTSSNPEPLFWNYAKQLGLNVSKFKTDFASSTANDRIQADLAAFAKTGQQESTPTFYVNGKYVANSQFVDSSGNPSIDSFSKILDTALKTAK